MFTSIGNVFGPIIGGILFDIDLNFHILFFRWLTNQMKYSSERVKLIQGKRKKIVFMKKLKQE